MDRLPRDVVSRLDRDLAAALDRIEGTNREIVVHGSAYPAGYTVQAHAHSRLQFLNVFSGVVLVVTRRGRWMIPPGHALIIPQALEHSVEMLSDVEMKSFYVGEGANAGRVGASPVVVEVTDLARSLLLEAIRLEEEMIAGRKADLVLALLLEEMFELEERPLGLPFPLNRRLAELCRDFLANPSPNARLDDWAEKLAMSRRTFTRFFRKETGVSFVTWRQQASVFACLPRLAAGVPVTQVALEAGYENAAAFATMLRRVLGASPRAYLAGGRFFERQ